MDEKLKLKYQQISQDYDDYISKINASYAPFYTRHIPKKASRMLDIGCGTGDMLREINKKFPQLALFGIDPTSQFVTRAKSKLPQATIVEGDAEKLPYEDAYFDFVMSHIVFQHVDREKALAEAKRVLKPNGVLMITEILSSKANLSQMQKAIIKVNQAQRDILLIKNFGLTKFRAGKRYAKSSDMAELTGIHRSRRFKYIEFVAFYEKHLPSCTVESLNANTVVAIFTSDQKKS